MSWWAIVVGAVVTTGLLPVAIRILRARGFVDVPNQRSSHGIPTPRGAGMAQLPGVTAVLLLAGPVPLAAWWASIGFTLLGALDDLRSIGAIRRLLIQVMLGGVTSVLLMQGVDGTGWKTPMVFATAVIVGTFVYTVNATNFMDGINGISVAHGIIFSLAYGMILWRVDAQQWLAIPAALLAVSLAVLPWNWGQSAKVFLGDSGSYLLGASASLLIVVTWKLGVGVVVAVAPFAIYMTDTVATLISRAWRNRPITMAHREHVYQRLVQQGWSHPRVALTVAAFSCASALAGILVQAQSIPTAVGIATIAGLSMTYLFLPTLTSGWSGLVRSGHEAG